MRGRTTGAALAASLLAGLWLGTPALPNVSHAPCALGTFPPADSLVMWIPSESRDCLNRYPWVEVGRDGRIAGYPRLRSKRLNARAFLQVRRLRLRALRAARLLLPERRAIASTPTNEYVIFGYPPPRSHTARQLGTGDPYRFEIVTDRPCEKGGTTNPDGTVSPADPRCYGEYARLPAAVADLVGSLRQLSNRLRRQ